MKKMIDLFSGLGGASAAFRMHQFERKMVWDVDMIDNNPKLFAHYYYDIVHDCQDIIDHYEGQQIDFLWASPPCDEFTLAFPAPRAVAAREGN